jgi:hypothetical protein
LVTFPTCDFLFFLSSSTLHRFHDHPAIKQKIARPDDYYQVHRVVLDYYRGLLPDPAALYLAPFSIKKGANIYSVIFGSAHPLGMDKFLQVAWKKDHRADAQRNQCRRNCERHTHGLKNYRKSFHSCLSTQPHHFFLNSGLRFSMKAVRPSCASGVW